jgi:hypothetical protein
MARRGKRAGIEGFAGDLGRLLGTAQAKAHGWIEQRHTIAKQLQQIRDAAAALLTELGAAAASSRRRRGRPSAASAVGAGVAAVARGRRKLSAKARKAISDAQKRRWAAVRAAKKQK